MWYVIFFSSIIQQVQKPNLIKVITFQSSTDQKKKPSSVILISSTLNECYNFCHFFKCVPYFNGVLVTILLLWKDIKTKATLIKAFD